MKYKYISLTIIVFLIGGLIGTGVWGYTQYRDKESYYRYIDNQVQKRYYDLVGSVETISTELSKLMVSSQTKENIVLFSKVWQSAYNAEEYLAQIPIRHEELTKSNKFFNQLGDYTFAMAQKSIKGEKLSPEDVNNLQQLYEYSVDLSQGLREVKDESIGGQMWINSTKQNKDTQMIKEETEEAEEQNPIELQFTQFEERMNLYPELIYDGPFSEHMIQGINPRLQGEKITEQEAEKKAREFIGEDKIQHIEGQPGMDGRIVTYNFKVQRKDHQTPTYICVSETEGYIVNVLDNKPVDQAKYSRKQAVEIADKFLKEKGFTDMVPTYSLKTDNNVFIVFAYTQDNVIMYPDLIKVKVALDNGDIIGFDSSHYLTLNYQREIPSPNLSPDEAKQSISVRANIEDEPKLCYIPTEFGGEIYCYEVKVNRGNEHFLVYINAETGIEEKILKALISQDGTLMI